MCSPLVSQSIDGEAGESPRYVPEAVIVIGCKLVVMSDSILQGIERDEGLWLGNLVLVAEVEGAVSLLHTAVCIT